MARPYLMYLALAAACVVLVAFGVFVRRMRGGQPPGLSGSTQAGSFGGPRRDPSKIERIKRYREIHGVGLKEAKDAIEAEDRGAPLPVPKPQASAAGSVQALVDAGQLIDAIRLYRAQTGAGLKEAKDAVERLRRPGT